MPFNHFENYIFVIDTLKSKITCQNSVIYDQIAPSGQREKQPKIGQPQSNRHSQVESDKVLKIGQMF